MLSRTLCRTHRSSLARLTTRGPRASRLSRSMSRTSSCATVTFRVLLALPKQPDMPQLRAEDSKRIVLVLPREGWYFHHRPSLPWDASAVTATGQAPNQHKPAETTKSQARRPRDPDSRSRPNRETGIPCFPPGSRFRRLLRNRETGTPRFPAPNSREAAGGRDAEAETSAPSRMAQE
jgi:hypothetical protein